MKIAVSAKGEDKNSVLDRRFGRSEFFLIFNTDNDEVNAVRNEGVSSGGGAGIAAASQVIELNSEVIITGSLGPNAYELIKKAGIKAYSCEELPANEAIEMYRMNRLKEINTSGNAHNGLK